MNLKFLFISLTLGLSVSTLGTVLVHHGKLTTRAYSSGVYIYLLLTFIAGKFFSASPEAAPFGAGGRGRENHPRRVLRLYGPAALAVFIGAAALRAGLVFLGFTHFRFNPRLELWPLIGVFLYPFAVYLQEAVLRGIFQQSFAEFFRNDARGQTLTVILPALVFAFFHLVYGAVVFTATGILALALGLAYRKTNSVGSVTLLHGAGGAGFLFFSYF